MIDIVLNVIKDYANREQRVNEYLTNLWVKCRVTNSQIKRTDPCLRYVLNEDDENEDLFIYYPEDGELIFGSTVEDYFRDNEVKDIIPIIKVSFERYYNVRLNVVY
jgi:hypothetical protein